MKNYYSAFDLSERGQGNFQLVYASQLYGTFFSVYASFETEIIKDECFIKKADFELVNYKGNIDLGLKDITYCDTEKLFHIHLQGMLEQRVINDAKAFKKLCLKKGQILTFKRKLFPFADSNTGLSKGVFDSEFYLRDGIWTVERIRLEDREKESELDSLDFAPSPRCIRSNIVASF